MAKSSIQRRSVRLFTCAESLGSVETLITNSGDSFALRHPK